MYQILNLDGANATVEEISSQGGTSFAIKTNLAVEEDILILIDTTAADYGKFYLFFEEEKRNYCQCIIYLSIGGMNGVRASGLIRHRNMQWLVLPKIQGLCMQKKALVVMQLHLMGGDEHRSIDDQHKSVWCSQTTAWIGGHYPRITTDSAWTAY